MSYYFGWRWGWVRFGRHMLSWHDVRFYPHFGKGRKVGCWRVRFD